MDDFEEPLAHRYLIPDDHPREGFIQIDRPVRDLKVVNDPLCGLLPKWEGQLNYAPAVWNEQAYKKSFEKFTYAPGVPSIKEAYPEHWEFAMWAVKKEFSFLRGSVILPMTATEKNVESTPAFPKAFWYKTEEAYLKDFGFKYYLEQYEAIKKGARPVPLWYMFLKKEVLKKKKIDDNDIRQILCADPAYSRIGLMFEQDQNTRMKNATEKHHGQCGWTPFEGGWNRRMKRLERDGNKYIEMDWSRFDGTIPNEVFHAIKGIRFGFLSKEYRTPENKSIYDWYCQHLTNRLVLLPSGEVTKQINGNPSGQVSTTMDNNMVNTFCQAFEFMFVNDLKLEDAKKEWAYYDTIVYGDDRVSSTPVVPTDYCEKVIKMYREIFGMWVKPENVKITDTIEGVSFCGFTNVLVSGRYLPVPSNCEKLVAALVTPVRKLPDLESLSGKITSYKILMHNLPDTDPAKQFVLRCELSINKHLRAREIEPISFTREMLDYLWRGGPKMSS
uniref:Non-structural polyprotein 1AB n=1 Tax=Miniopterus bat astrovirus TaxID=3141885 RepID=A0AAU7E2D7_9VIRU